MDHNPENGTDRSATGGGEVTVCWTSKEGRVAILAPALGLPPLVRVEGEWMTGLFWADDMNENLSLVQDPDEVQALLDEAKAALAANPHLPKYVP